MFQIKFRKNRIYITGYRKNKNAIKDERKYTKIYKILKKIKKYDTISLFIVLLVFKGTVGGAYEENT